MSTPILSDKGTLLVPVPTEALELKAAIEIGGVTLVPKAEHHITVFGFRIGRLLLAAMKEDMRLRPLIETNVVTTDWAWRRRGFFFVLERSDPKPLTTIIELVTAPISKFYGEVAQDVDPERWPELAAALASPPPPHITLYTSDPSGVGGIGLDREDELKMALNGGNKKLSARALSMV